MRSIRQGYRKSRTAAVPSSPEPSFPRFCEAYHLSPRPPSKMQILALLSVLFSCAATFVEAAVIGSGQTITLEHDPLVNALEAPSSPVTAPYIQCYSSVPSAQKEAIVSSCTTLLFRLDHSPRNRTFGPGPGVEVPLPARIQTGESPSVFFLLFFSVLFPTSFLASFQADS